MFLLRTDDLMLSIMVYVFPEPICPYAKIQTLYPSTQEVITGRVPANTTSCREQGQNLQIISAG